MNTVKLEKKFQLRNTFNSYWTKAPELRHTKQLIEYLDSKFTRTTKIDKKNNSVYI